MALFKNEKTLEFNKEKESLESSDEEELDELPPTDQHKLNGKELTFTWQGLLGHNVSIAEGSSPVYFAEVSDFERHKPDMTLHRGAKEGAVLGASFYGWVSRSMKCGIGADDISMVWTEMKLKGPGVFGTGHFAFEWKGKDYQLRRATSADTQATGAAKFLRSHFKVVEEATGELIALYVSNPVGKIKGTMKLKAGVDEELEVLCVLGCASWRDRMRRRRPKGGGGG